MSAPSSDMPVWLKRLDGCVAVITGANSGIGWEAARMLAGAGCRVVLACRRSDAANEAADRIRSQVAGAQLDVVQLDLGDLGSVAAGAEAVRALIGEGRIDLLINNAGVMAPPTRTVTVDAFELQLGVNHLGHFAWTLDLLDQLTDNARVVQVSSIAHRFARMKWDDLLSLQSYNSWGAYGQSKLANLLFVGALDRRLAERHPNAKTRPIAVACHPGYASTNLQTAFDDRGTLQERVKRFGNSILAQSAAAGAEPTVYAATSEHIQGDDYVGPASFFQMWGPPVKVGRTAAARDTRSQDRLWEWSEELTGRSWS